MAQCLPPKYAPAGTGTKLTTTGTSTHPAQLTGTGGIIGTVS